MGHHKIWLSLRFPRKLLHAFPASYIEDSKYLPKYPSSRPVQRRTLQLPSDNFQTLWYWLGWKRFNVCTVTEDEMLIWMKDPSGPVRDTRCKPQWRTQSYKHFILISETDAVAESDACLKPFGMERSAANWRSGKQPPAVNTCSPAPGLQSRWFLFHGQVWGLQWRSCRYWIHKNKGYCYFGSHWT